MLSKTVLDVIPTYCFYTKRYKGLRRVTKRTQCSMRKTASLTACTLTGELWEETQCRLINISTYISFHFQVVVVIVRILVGVLNDIFQFDVSTNDFQQSRV